MKEKTFTIPIFNCEIILINDTFETIQKEFSETYPDLSHLIENRFDGRYWVIEYNGIVTRYILMCDGYNTGNVYHESLHAAGEILHICGIKTDHNNDEMLAYLMEYIAEQILIILELWTETNTTS
jgi:hypothetical protein